MVRPEGLEPPAYWFEASRSIQLSYGRTLVFTKRAGVHAGSRSGVLPHDYRFYREQTASR